MTDIKRGVMNKFNRGEVSPAGFAREDVDRIDNSCESMVNFLPQRLGPMKYRPGAGLIDVAVQNDTVLIPFVTEIADPVLIVFEGGANAGFKILRNDALVARAASTTGWQNGLFATGFAAGQWVDADEGLAVSVITGGEAILKGTGTDSAKIFQTSDTTQAAPTGITIKVTQGIVKCQIGTSGVDSANLFEGFLEFGIHELEIDPPSAFTITLSNDNLFRGKVDTCDVITAITTISFEILQALNITFATGDILAKLKGVRAAQSADVMYFASKDVIPFKLIRWGATSFSMVRFVNVDGPYQTINNTSITMNPTAPFDGNITVVSSKQFFDQTATFDFDTGTLLKMAVTGQTVSVQGSADDVATGGVLVFGSGDARQFKFSIVQDVAPTTQWTVHLEKSFDELTWQLLTAYTTVQTDTLNNDLLDGTEIFYRLRIETADSATLTLGIVYDYGTVESQGRCTATSTATSADFEFFVALNVDQTVRDWYIGSWGGKNEYPTAVAFYEGRLWFAGSNKIWASVTDFFNSFDRNLAGASASIQRTIGFGAAEEILWLAPSSRMVLGTAISEIDVKSTTFGEVLTDLNTNLKVGSDQGVAKTPPLVLDQEVIFVQRGGNKLIGIDFNIQAEKHLVEDFNMVNPEVLSAGVERMAFTRNPETRIYLVMTDGTMRVLLRDNTEDVLGWSRITVQKHNGTITVQKNIVDVAVIPGTPEDQVYITTDDGNILKFAKTTEVAGASISKHFDSFQQFVSPGATIQLSTNEFASGETVGVWVDGVDDGDKVVDGSTQITGVTVGTNVTVGYRYTADYKTNKLTSYDDLTVLASRKRILNTGLLMKDYVVGSLTIGPSLTELDALPLLENGQAPVSGDYDFFPFEFSGVSETDPRIHIRAIGPCDILALVFDVKNTTHRTKKAAAATAQQAQA